MRERVFIRKCPDGCGKDEYDLGPYRGFNLYQKPFYDGWYVYAAMVHPKDELDELLLKEFEGLSGKICLDTETSDHLTVEQCEQYVIEAIDKFWDKKQRIITIVKAKAGLVNLRIRIRNLPQFPICEICKRVTEEIGRNGELILFACPKCNPEVFAELERMKPEEEKPK